MGEKVSVVVCAFNEEKYLSCCLKSLINQDYLNIEIIVVDDGSTDGTWGIVTDFAKIDSRIVPIRHLKNLGKVTAQNTAYSVVTGDYIAICGGDDWYPEYRIRSQLDFIRKTKVDFTFGNMEVGFSSGKDEGFLIAGKLYGGEYCLSHDWKDILLGASASCGTAFFSKKIARDIYPIPEDLPYEDRWFTAIAALYGKVKMQNEVLGIYRQHNENSFGLLATRLGFFDFFKKYVSVYKRNLKVNAHISSRIIKSGVDAERVYWIKKLSDFIAANSVASGVYKRIKFSLIATREGVSFSYFKFIVFQEFCIFRVWLAARKRMKSALGDAQ